MPDLPDLAAHRWILDAAFAAYAVVIVGFLLLERRRPAATLAWIFALVFLPVAGLVAYVLIGRRGVRRRRRARIRRALNPTEATRNMARLDASPAALPDPMRGLVAMAIKTAAAPLRRADSIRVLDNRAGAFEAMEEAIASARERIHLQFYIWRPDATGTRMLACLAERARAGVHVRLLVDDFGTLSTPDEHFAPLVQAGGEVASFEPLRLHLRASRSRAQFRNHRKLLTVDGEVGFVGGINIGDEYRGVDENGRPWTDLLVRLDGDAVLSLEAIFLEDWLVTTGRLLPVEPPGAPALAHHPVTPARSEGPLLQIIASGPDVAVAPTIAMQFAGAIGSAQQRCFIATPYFVPDEGLLLLLRTAALRGVDVRILVPSAENNDSRIVAFAARSYFDELVAVGCRIFEYQPGMLHAKILIVDECVSAIGSANMDVRSFYINYEVTAMFYDAGVTRDVAAVFERDLLGSVEVRRGDRRSLSIGVRLAEAAARVLSPLL